MAFLVFAVLASAVGIAAVLIRNRRPTTMQSSIGDFERGLRALAPVPETGTDAGSGGEVRGGADRDDDRVIHPEIKDEIEAEAADVGQRDRGAGRTG